MSATTELRTFQVKVARHLLVPVPRDVHLHRVEAQRSQALQAVPPVLHRHPVVVEQAVKSMSACQQRTGNAAAAPERLLRGTLQYGPHACW
jgi:hypothetical protein